MKFSTSTITNENTIVPWLAAEGPLAYSPLSPPTSDYFFLYNFILPGIFSKSVNLRQHYWFGDYSGQNSYSIYLLKNFWEDARIGRVNPIFTHEPVGDLMHLEVPIAVFKHSLKKLRESHYLFMQHGSYLITPISEQPLIKDGFVLLYRGIGDSKKFNLHQMPDDSNLIDQYRKTQSNYFTDSVRSFAIAHSGTFRGETGHLLSASELPFPESPLVEERHNGLMKLLKITSQCYTLSKNLAKYKFGPSYVTFKTPVANIRICTYFSGEHEVKILSLDKLIPIKATRCKFSPDD
ncbi:MAG: hypothetical protein NTW94_08220 [Legionellales bacterium]|nr:hypothetical protein [Legionellales bacterium]